MNEGGRAGRATCSAKSHENGADIEEDFEGTIRAECVRYQVHIMVFVFAGGRYRTQPYIVV